MNGKTIDKAKPRVIVARKATDPKSRTAGLPRSEEEDQIAVALSKRLIRFSIYGRKGNYVN